MELGLRGRAVVVTASSKGIGRACAIAFAQEGADVAICARGEEALLTTEAELRAVGGGRVRASVADLTKAEDCRRIVDGAAGEFGRLDVLVSISGGPPPGPVDAFDDDAFHAAIDLTLMSSVRLARAAVPHMREAGWGRIINVQSVSVKQPLDGLVLSNTSRAGAAGFTKTLANELAAEGITVNTVCPGPTMTDRIRDLADRRGMALEDAIRFYVADVPMRRLGTPEEIAAAVVFLASERAAFITGVALQVDGGTVRALL